MLRFTKPRIFIESPYAGDNAKHTTYLKKCVLDSISRGENPYASHGFFTQYLDDKVPRERHLGIDLGNQWRMLCDMTVFYVDLGWSPGMIEGRAYCVLHECRFVERSIL